MPWIEDDSPGQPLSGTPLRDGFGWDFAWTAADPFRTLRGPPVGPASLIRHKVLGGDAYGGGYFTVLSNTIRSIYSSEYTEVGVVLLDGVNAVVALSARPEGEAAVIQADRVTFVIWGNTAVDILGTVPRGTVHYVVRKSANQRWVWFNGRFFGSASLSGAVGTGAVLPAVGAQAGSGPNIGGGQMAPTVGVSLVLRTALALPDRWCVEASSDVWGAVFEPQTLMFPEAAAGAALPTLSLPTFVPGSLTATGWRPRVTATWS